MEAIFTYKDGHTSGQHDGSQNVVKIEWENGCIELYQDGLLHCEDGPALVHSNGSREYWLHGKRRTRSLGTAIEWADGEIVYEEDEVLPEEVQV